MTFKRLVLFSGLFLLGLGSAVATQAADYNLVGGGGQFQIGGGLPLPIQVVETTGGTMMNNVATGTVFPPLLVPTVPGKTVMGTTVMAVQKQLTVPQHVLSRVGQQRTLGQFGQNPNLYAVGTNLNFQWPGLQATFNTTKRTGGKTTTFATILGANIRYSNPLANKFGGPAQFRVTPGASSGLLAQPVTIYGIAVKGPGNPPCIHTALTPALGTGGNPACVAGIAMALPTLTTTNTTQQLGVAGGPVSNSMTTPGRTAATIGVGPAPGVGVGKFGPNGTVTHFFFTPNSNPGFTNMATTVGYPWTTGMLTISNSGAAGTPEVFMITGKDNRTAGGAGSIQLVAGGLGQRTTSGSNANRAWVRLQLSTDAPAASPGMLAAGAGLILLGFGYASRRLAAAKRSK
jgi:hypothetical protein